MNKESLPSTHFPPDYHSHTLLCRHAVGQPIDYVRAARAMRIPEIAVTDHAPGFDGCDMSHRMDAAQFETYLGWIDMARRADDASIPVLVGLEADFCDGCEETLGEWLKQQPLDVVLGSVHYFENSDVSSLWDTADVATVWRRYFEIIGRLADSRLYDVVGHIDLPKRNGDRPKDRHLPDIVKPALDKISAAGMAIEINTSGLRHPVAEPYPSPLILQWAREREVPITFGSDAHCPANVGYRFEIALAMAREAGYERSAIFRRRIMMTRPLPGEETGEACRLTPTSVPD